MNLESRLEWPVKECVSFICLLALIGKIITHVNIFIQYEISEVIKTDDCVKYVDWLTLQRMDHMVITHKCNL